MRFKEERFDTDWKARVVVVFEPMRILWHHCGLFWKNVLAWNLNVGLDLPPGAFPAQFWLISCSFSAEVLLCGRFPRGLIAKGFESGQFITDVRENCASIS